MRSALGMSLGNGPRQAEGWALELHLFAATPLSGVGRGWDVGRSGVAPDDTSHTWSYSCLPTENRGGKRRQGKERRGLRKREKKWGEEGRRKRVSEEGIVGRSNLGAEPDWQGCCPLGRQVGDFLASWPSPGVIWLNGAVPAPLCSLSISFLSKPDW